MKTKKGRIYYNKKKMYHFPSNFDNEILNKEKYIPTRFMVGNIVIPRHLVQYTILILNEIEKQK